MSDEHTILKPFDTSYNFVMPHKLDVTAAYLLEERKRRKWLETNLPRFLMPGIHYEVSVERQILSEISYSYQDENGRLQEETGELIEYKLNVVPLE